MTPTENRRSRVPLRVPARTDGRAWAHVRARTRRWARTFIFLAAVVSVLVAWGPAPSSAQVITEYPHLGLSAAPDSYVSYKEIQPGEPFTLYMIMIGPYAQPLPFDFVQTRWAVYAVCCGATADITGVRYPDNIQHEGEPIGGVSSVVENCLDADVITLAEIDFLLLLNSPGAYLMAAGAIGPTLDCQGSTHLLMDLAVEVLVPVPNRTRSWGEIKALYK
jgi:hypothetical protein